MFFDSLQFQYNYITAFRKCALIFATSSIWGGWHHTEVHEHEWWVRKFSAYGFVYDDALTQEIRTVARQEGATNRKAPNGKRYFAAHVSRSVKVFINPVVASLPQHYRLFPEFGCYGGKDPTTGQLKHRECGKGRTNADDASLETPLDPSFYPLRLTPDMHMKWENHLKQQLNLGTGTTQAQIPAAADTTGIKSMDPLDHPLMRWRAGKLDTADLPVLPVAMWPYLEFGTMTAEALHIEENGVNESKYLTLTKNLYDLDDPNVVWVGDTGFAFGYHVWCAEYLKNVREAKKLRQERNMPLQWPIVIADFTDGAALQRCRDIEKEVGKDFVWYTVRSIVTQRHFDNSTQWVNTGRMMNLKENDGTVHKHAPLIVRTDTVQTVKDVLDHKFKMALYGPVEDIERNVDVSHYWPVDGHDVGTVESLLRTTVSRTILNMADQDNITVYVNLAGAAVRTGRRGVQATYVVLEGSELR
jgi:hypothetical protein